MSCVFNVVTTETHLPHRCVIHMAITVRRVCSCFVHAQGERGFRDHSSHYIQHVCVEPSAETPLRGSLDLTTPTLLRARSRGVAQSTLEKPFSGAASEVKQFGFFISDLPVIASVVNDQLDVRCRSLQSNIQ